LRILAVRRELNLHLLGRSVFLMSVIQYVLSLLIQMQPYSNRTSLQCCEWRSRWTLSKVLSFTYLQIIVPPKWRQLNTFSQLNFFCKILKHCIFKTINALFFLTLHFTSLPWNPNLNRKLTDQMYSIEITKLLRLGKYIKINITM